MTSPTPVPFLPSHPPYFPIERLPPELLHSVCAYLKPADIASLRLLSRKAATVGLKHLVPEVHLCLRKESLKKLEAIAEYPVVRENVRSFFFETDALPNIEHCAWRIRLNRAQNICYMQKFPQTPRVPAIPNGEWWRLRLQGTSEPLKLYTAEQLEAGWHSYSTYIREQLAIEEAGFFQNEIISLMGLFPSLEALETSFDGRGRASTHTMQAGFAPGLLYIPTLEQDIKGRNMFATRSLLLGAYEAGLNIKSLRGSCEYWSILAVDDDSFAKMLHAIRHFQVLDLNTTLDEEHGLITSVGDPERFAAKAAFQKGRFVKFITSAPSLEHLTISSDWEHMHPPCLTKIVGDFQWRCLKSVSLARNTTTEEDLVHFCTRHCQTLRKLSLERIDLDEGCWLSALERMRDIFCLNSFKPLPYLCDKTGHLLVLSQPWEDQYFDKEDDPHSLKLKAALEMYMVRADSKGGSLADFLRQNVGFSLSGGPLQFYYEPSPLNDNANDAVVGTDSID